MLIFSVSDCCWDWGLGLVKSRMLARGLWGLGWLTCSCVPFSPGLKLPVHDSNLAANFVISWSPRILQAPTLLGHAQPLK